MAEGEVLSSELEEAEYAVLDLETTGLNPKKDEIIAIAMIPMKGLKIQAKDCFYSLVKSDKFNYKSITFHGICPGDLHNAPRFEDVTGEILDRLEGRILVGYATLFDIDFLKRAFRKLRIKMSFERYVDVAELEAGILRKKGMAVSYRLDLDAIMKTYSISIKGRHNALSDAYATARIFQKQLSRLIDFRTTLFDLIRIGRRLFF
ncbi:exonuclease, DNA polymerase III, epsilon subunit family [Archaeoglobus sulfaticallidus PM70-1]|uniref:Exonuclease, DNA polymerase III, epsilon subunit family n=1 Tax=Archaeoglobus sulfaticallidus PM70-1 TaxID=387631 RepID=N0BAJ2_9EURY|nr:3'-5' exonuclease [Archaeoglobus sulfaticallidus]AGK60629.1 exonuclease, DNA polymerase III, epsilon subunit family [Archaeoglobus sulfaticallidus PM70-1]